MFKNRNSWIPPFPSLLPKPQFTATSHEPAPATTGEEPKTTLVATRRNPPPAYRNRRNWIPQNQQDFGDGGAYPEIHVAQYPLDMGRKQNQRKVTGSSGSLALQVDESGRVRYDALARRGHDEKRVVFSQHKDLVPMDIHEGDPALDRPSEEQIQENLDKTRNALMKIVSGKSASDAQKLHSMTHGKAEPQFVRYTPQSLGTGQAGQTRIVRLSAVQEDPLEPPRFKHRKLPPRPGSPPAPVMHSPPRKATAEEHKEWQIPPCISNWKNAKGYTIPLDKRLAADGRGLQEVL